MSELSPSSSNHEGEDPTMSASTEDSVDISGRLDEASLDSLYRVAAEEYMRLYDQPGVDHRDSVGMSQKIAENTGVSLSVAAAVVASANSVRRSENR